MTPAAPRAGAAHPALRTLLAALDDAGLRWCLLRGADELVDPAGDIDLLLHRADVPALREAVRNRGSLAEAPAWGRRPHLQFAGDVAGVPAKLDVMTELAFGPFGELPTTAAEPVLAARVRRGSFWAPAPADAFWVRLLHALFDRPAMRPDDRQALAALSLGARCDESALADVVGAACPAPFDPGGIIDSVEAGRWSVLEALAPELAERWPGTTTLSRARTVAVRRTLRRAHRLQRTARMASKRRARSTG